MMLTCFSQSLLSSSALCHVFGAVSLAPVAVVRFLHFNFLQHSAVRSFSPLLDVSYLCQTTPTCVQLTSAPQHLETISNYSNPLLSSCLLFIYYTPFFIPPVLQPSFLSVFMFNSVSLPLALALPLVRTCVTKTRHPFVITAMFALFSARVLFCSTLRK